MTLDGAIPLTRPSAETQARAVRLLVAEPEFGEALTVGELEQARQQAVLPAIDVPAGPLDLAELRRRPGIKGELHGFLVLAGTLMAGLRIDSRYCGRLISVGGLVLLEGPVSESIPVRLDWVAVEDTRLACFDERLLEMVRLWPRLLPPILRRAGQNSRQALMQQAISQLPRVEDRLLALFWSLADRQGVVRSDGIWIELAATHDTIASLVGGQRPTISLGLSRLSEGGLIRAQPGGWLLNPDSRRALGGIELEDQTG